MKELSSKYVMVLCLLFAPLALGHNLLPVIGPDPGYNVVTTASGKIVALTGTGLEINTYIANKISNAGAGDSIRIDMYIIEHAEDRTSFFYDALVEALGRGASIEIVTEGKNLDIDQTVSEARYRNTCEFLYGYPSTECSSYPGTSPGPSPTGIKYEPIGPGGSIDIYVCSRGCDSTVSTAINHNKVALLDISGQRNIIVTSSNIRFGGATDWQAGVDLDGDIYTSQWTWWNSVIDSDICFAQGGSNCEVGNGGYESNEEDDIVSYLPGPTPNFNAPEEWLANMQYEPGCSLRVMMGSWSNTEVGLGFLDGMARVAALGCDVNFIHGQVDNADRVLSYVNGRFEAEYQAGVHAKIILWQGIYDGEHESFAWVGSWNTTRNALRNNDENLVRIKTSLEFEAFWNFFYHVDGEFVIPDPGPDPQPEPETSCFPIKAKSAAVAVVCL